MTTQQYLPPGPYISQGRVPSSIITASVPRALCIVGPGSPVLQTYDVAVRRGYISREVLTVTATGGYQHAATLAWSSDQIKETAVLESYDGLNYATVPSKYWGFASATQMYILSTQYSAGKTYYLSYQTTDNPTDVLGATPPDLRSIIRVGSRPGVIGYDEGEDFTATVEYSQVTAGSGNTGDGVIAVDGTSAYSALEPRTYTLTITATGDVSTAEFEWYGDTVASGAGVGTAAAQVSLEDGLVVAFTSGSFDIGDVYTFTVANTGQITWGVSQTMQETKTAADVRKDYTGVITGTPGTYYVVLSHIPASDLAVVDSGANPVVATQVSGKSYVYFSSDPSAGAPLTVTYTWFGDAPSYGSTYYVSYEYGRPEILYDTPRLVFSPEQLYSEVGEKTPQNLLALAGDIAFHQGLSYLFYVQISDPDGDGTYLDTDFIAGITASESKQEITDLVVLDSTASIRSAERASILACSSPTQKKYRMGWMYMPSGTTTGDLSTPNTLVYESTISMALTPDSPALGRYVLMGQTWVQRTFTLGDGSTYTATLPGWAIAVAVAALQDTFSAPSDTLLRKAVPGFDDIETPSEPEFNMRAANNCFMLQKLGSKIRVFDTTTTSIQSDDVHEPSAVVQKDAVTRIMNAQLDATIIGLVPESTADAISTIRASITTVLSNMVANGNIGAYEDNAGNIRNIDAMRDIFVERVQGSRTGFNFKYVYFLRYPIKRLFGTYYVDQNVLFGSGGTPTVTNT